MKRIGLFFILFFISITSIAQTETTVPPKAEPIVSTSSTTSAKPVVEPTTVESTTKPDATTASKTTVSDPNTKTDAVALPSGTAPIPAVIKPPEVVMIGDGCPIYKIKLKLKNGTSYIGFYSRSDCNHTEVFTTEMLAEDIKIKKKDEDTTLDIVTQYNILELPASAITVSTNSTLGSVALTASPAKRLVYYEMMGQKKIQKLDIEDARLMEKTVNTTQELYSDYKGSHRMVVLMKTKPYKCFITVDFSDEDCDQTMRYVIVSYNENANEFDLRKFILSKKEVFIGDCNETNNDKQIRQLLEPFNIAFFRENID